MKWWIRHRNYKHKLLIPPNNWTGKGYLPSAQAFCQYTLPERFPPGQWASFQKYLRLARLLQTIMKCLQKKCFRITRCVRREKHHHCLFTASLLRQDDHVQRCSRTTHTESAWSIDANRIVCGLGIFKLITNLNEKRPSSVFSTLRLNFADNFPSYRRIIK